METKYLKFLSGCVANGLPEPEQEAQFAKEYGRKWKTDFMFTHPNGKRIAVEIEGGAFSGGRHTRGVGFTKDMEKYNVYSMMGITLLRFTSQQADKEPILCGKWIKTVFDGLVDATLFQTLKQRICKQIKIPLK